jgi:hypothetical protein
MGGGPHCHAHPANRYASNTVQQSALETRSTMQAEQLSWAWHCRGLLTIVAGLLRPTMILFLTPLMNTATRPAWERCRQL